jgi:hypothetical protein
MLQALCYVLWGHAAALVYLCCNSSFIFISSFNCISLVGVRVHSWGWDIARRVNFRPFDRFGVSFRRKRNGTVRYFIFVSVTKRLNAIKIYSVPTTKRLTKFCCFVSFQLNSIHLLCTIADKKVCSN